MATLAVWQFAAADGADHAVPFLERLALDADVVILDAAVVAWEPGAPKPWTQQDRPASAGVLGSGFWGLLFGLVFFVPLLGAAIGAATGAFAGALKDVGIDDHFINRVRDGVTPGTSALFVLTADGVVGRLHDAWGLDPRPELIATRLDADQEAALRSVFGP